MSIQKLIKGIKNLNGDTKEIMALKELAAKEEEKISKSNKRFYKRDIELSRKRKKINNSKQAIKKAWPNRKAKKALIKKHISILKEMKSC